jgi:plastocyanin
MRRRCWLAALACAVLVPAWAEGETHTVRIAGMKFVPETLTVRRGDRIVWRNEDLVPHTATAAGVFDSGVIAPGRTATRRASRAGRFPYVCTLHPGMKGTVVVQ